MKSKICLLALLASSSAFPAEQVLNNIAVPQMGLITAQNRSESLRNFVGVDVNENQLQSGCKSLILSADDKSGLAVLLAHKLAGKPVTINYDPELRPLPSACFITRIAF